MVVFGDQVTKYYVIVYLLFYWARQDGQDGKNGDKIMQLKWPKYQKPKDENMGWTKQKLKLESSANICFDF